MICPSSSKEDSNSTLFASSDDTPALAATSSDESESPGKGRLLWKKISQRTPSPSKTRTNEPVPSPSLKTSTNLTGEDEQNEDDKEDSPQPKGMSQKSAYHLGRQCAKGLDKVAGAIDRKKVSISVDSEHFQRPLNNFSDAALVASAGFSRAIFIVAVAIAFAIFLSSIAFFIIAISALTYARK